ncbi:MAG: AI-2E family transporter [Thermoanaerobaculia bacterium]
MSGQEVQKAIREGLFQGGWRLVALALILVAAWFVQQVVLLAFLGLLFGNLVTGGVDWLEKRHFKRPLGTLAILLAFFGVLVAIGWWIAPQVVAEFRQIQNQLPSALHDLETWLSSRMQQLSASVGGDGGNASVQQAIDKQLQGLLSYAYPAVMTVAFTIVGFFIVLFITIYLSVDPNLYRKGFLHLFAHSRRERMEQTIDEVSYTLRRWMGGQLMGMAIIGGLTTIGLWLLGVKTALALGVLAGVLEFIPFFGPILSFFPAAAVAFLQSPQLALWVLLLYVAIQQLEGHLIIPLVMQSQVQVPPILTILAGVIFGTFFGFLGLLTAVPMTAAAIVVIKMMYVEDRVGDELPLPGPEKERKEAGG